LQLLDEIGCAGEQHAIAGIDHGMAERGGEMRFANARRSSVILPGVRHARSGLAIRSTRSAAIWWRLSVLSDTQVSNIW
jgi:hypothetical protein